jgi:hypothetical protein
MEKDFLNQNYENQKISNRLKTFEFIFCKIILILLFQLLIFYIKIKVFAKLFKEIKNEEDVKLYMKNRTEFYFKYRLKTLKKYNITYNESNLITFQDKLNYLIIHEDPELKSGIVDKIKIHQYSKKILGKDICIPILKVYENVDEINFDDLPEKFVLKTNHGSSMNLFCKDKLNFDINMAKKTLQKWKNINYGLKNSEFQYFTINRKIFASPYLGDNIIDYEIYCFNNRPKFIRVRKLLFEKNHTILHNYYNLDWKLTDIETGLKIYHRMPKIKIKKPKYLNLMLDYSKKLSAKFVFVRVDFYEINNKVYLSEMTFSPSNALMKFKNIKQSRYLGSLLDISKIRNNLI